MLPHAPRNRRLLQPREAVALVADGDVDAPVAAQVGELHVEAGDDGLGLDLDAVLDERDLVGGHVLEPEDPLLHARAADDVEIAVAVEIERLRVDGDDDAGQLVLDPGVAVERIVGDGEPRDRVLLGGAAGRVLAALVRGDHLGPAVGIEVREEDPDVGPAVERRGRNDPPPPRGPALLARVLEVDQVRELARHHDVRIAVAVHVADGHVLGRASLLALGQRVEIQGRAAERRRSGLAAGTPS